MSVSSSTSVKHVAVIAFASCAIATGLAAARSSSLSASAATGVAALLIGGLAAATTRANSRVGSCLALVVALAAGEAARHWPALVAQARHRWSLYVDAPRYDHEDRAHEIEMYRFLSRCAPEVPREGRVFLISDWFPLPDLQFWFYPRNVLPDQTLVYGVRADDPFRIARSLRRDSPDDEVRAYVPVLLGLIRQFYGDVFHEKYLPLLMPETQAVIGMNTSYDMRGYPGFETVLDLGPGFYLLRRKTSRPE